MTVKVVVLIGPQKTASSLFFDYCKLLPLGLSRNKETFFFSLRKCPTISDFYSLFPPDCEILVHVEPSYFSSSFALERLCLISDSLKIVICIRNPVDLLRSFLLHLYSVGIINKKQASSPDVNLLRMLDPINYLKYIPLWSNSFQDVYFYSFEQFVFSSSLRKNILVNIFPSLNDVVVADLPELSPSNVSRLYPSFLSPLRQFTPYLNILPFSDKIISFKQHLLGSLDGSVRPPLIPLNSSLSDVYVDQQITFFKAHYPEFLLNFNS